MGFTSGADAVHFPLVVIIKSKRFGSVLALPTLRPFCAKMAASTDAVKVALFAGVFMSAAVVPLKLIEVAIWTEAVLHGLSHLLPSKVGVPKWPGLQMLGLRMWQGDGHL